MRRHAANMTWKNKIYIQESFHKRMKRRKMIGLFLGAVLLVSAPLFHEKIVVTATQSTLDKINQAENEKKQTQGVLDNTQDSISDLSNQKSSVQSQLNDLTEKLTQVGDNLEEIEEKITTKKTEIEQTEEELEEAIIQKDAQYAAMKERVKFIYEKRDTLYMEMLFTSSSFGELLNKNEYIEKVAEYDQKMLEEFQQVQQDVEAKQEQLEEEMNELEDLRVSAEEEQSKVSGLVSATAENVAGYADQIANAQQVADALAAQLSQQEQDIAALKKQYEEELAKSRLSQASAKTDVSNLVYAGDDRYLLANLIYCEAGNQPYEGQLAVGAVVINRVRSSVFPNSIVGVIYQRKQFSPVSDGHLALALAQNRATPACYQAADEAMAGASNVGDCVFFRTPIPGLTGIQIGGHIFY